MENSEALFFLMGMLTTWLFFKLFDDDSKH